MSCGMAPSPQSFCGTSSAPGLEFLAELAGDFGTMSEEKKGQSSSSSSSSSSEEEETAEEMARKMQKKEMKAAKKMRKAEEKQMKRRMEEGAAGRSEDMQCSTALLDAPESPAAMDVSYAPADSSLIIHQGRGESVIMRMAASPDGLVVSDRESPQTRSQLLVCQGSACRCGVFPAPDHRTCKNRSPVAENSGRICFACVCALSIVVVLQMPTCPPWHSREWW